MSRTLDPGKTSRYKVEEMLRSINWHSDTPPPGYRYGIGRGDHGFVTNVMASTRGAEKKMSAEEKAAFGDMDAIFADRHHKRKRDDEVTSQRNGNGDGERPAQQKLAVDDIFGALDALEQKPATLNPTSSSAAENHETGGAGSTRALAAQLRSEVGMALAAGGGGAAGSSTGGGAGGGGSGPSEDNIRQMGSDSEPQTWISRARMLRQQGKERRARETLLQGGRVTKSALVFEEAIEHEHNPEERRKIAEDAVYNVCPTASNLWLCLANMQSLHAKKQGVLQDAVERCPNDEELWLALIGSFPQAEHLTLLKEARKKVPTSSSVWVLLAHEVPQRPKGREVLVEGIKRMPGSLELRIAAAEFEEKHYEVLQQAATAEAEGTSVVELPQARIASIAAAIVDSVSPSPAEVVAMAQKAIAADRGHTFAVELLRTTFAPHLSGTWVEDMQAKITPLEESAAATIPAAVKSPGGFCRGLLLAMWRLLLHSAAPDEEGRCPAAQTALLSFISDEVAVPLDPASQKQVRTGEWQQLAQETADAFPSDGAICVIMARHLFANGRQDLTNALFEKALAAAGADTLHDAEAVVVGAAKLAALGDDWARAESILENHIQACTATSTGTAANDGGETNGTVAADVEGATGNKAQRLTPRIFVKLAVLHRERGNAARELAALARGIAAFPHANKLWCMKLLHASKNGGAAASKAIRQDALSAAHCRGSPLVWAYAATLESEVHGNPAGARALLTEGMQLITRLGGAATSGGAADTTALWEARVRLEELHSGGNAAFNAACDAVKALSAAAATRGVGGNAVAVSPFLANRRIELTPPHDRSKVADYVVKKIFGRAKHGLVDVAIAKLYWAVALKNSSKGTLIDAFKMMRRAIKHSPRCGDCYALMHRFLTEIHNSSSGGGGQGTYGAIFASEDVAGVPSAEDFPLTTDDILAQAAAAAPNEGPAWLRVSKEVVENVSIRGLGRVAGASVGELVKLAAQDPSMVV